MGGGGGEEMVLCFTNNIKQGSERWQKLTGHVLVRTGGRKPLSDPCSVSAAGARQQKVIEGEERCRCVFWSYQHSLCACVCVRFQCQRLDGDRRSDTQTKLRCQREKWKTRPTTLSERMSFSSPCLPVFILSPPFSLLHGPFFFPQPSLCLPLLRLSPELWYGNLSTATAQG